MSEVPQNAKTYFTFIESGEAFLPESTYEDTGNILRGVAADILLHFPPRANGKRVDVTIHQDNLELPAIVNFGAHVWIDRAGAPIIELGCYQKDTDELLEDYRYEIGPDGLAYRFKGFYLQHDIVGMEGSQELLERGAALFVKDLSEEGLTPEELREAEDIVDKEANLAAQHRGGLELERMAGINYTPATNHELLGLREFLLDRFEEFDPKSIQL